MTITIKANDKSIIALLNKDLPKYRQAYSDRTAWLMACVSELAYIRFNPLFSKEEKKKYFVEAIEKLIDKERKNSLTKLIDLVSYDADAEKEQLKTELTSLRMELIEPTFDEQGTQAILVDFKDHVVLGFRGTEATSIKDIKADAKAVSMQCPSGGKIHKGFYEAYEAVESIIQARLNEKDITQKPLFITGHSLGGALATIAAKRLVHQGGISACYTFGSPRVGDEEWVSQIKTPLYRLVNAADCVTMLPPGQDIVTIFSWLISFVPTVGKKLRVWILSKIGGYYHGGDMKYLTNCPCADYKDVRLLFYVSGLHRIKAVIYKKLPWKTMLSDHSIAVYRKKLEMFAKQRNDIN